MKFLITGGAGFIGSHLSEALLQRGDELVLLDNLSTGSLSNIQPLLEHPRYRERVRFIQGSILEAGCVRDCVAECDSVVHLAAAVGVQTILDDPLGSIRTNVRGTEIVLEACAEYERNLLLASTSEVYGKHEQAPLVETDDCVYGNSQRLRWSYAAGKLMDEFNALAYQRTDKLNVVIVRFFNTVGPRQSARYGMVIPRFVAQALSGAPISVHGDGSQTRTFTHIREVVQALLQLIENPKAFGEVINIGGVEEVSILELAKRVVKATGSRSTIQFIPYEQAYSSDYEDMRRRVPSTEKLKRIIGKAPELPLDAILRDIIKETSPALVRTHNSSELPSDSARP